MGIFTEFHQKRFAENADVIPTNGDTDSKNGIEKYQKNAFTSHARNPHSPQNGVDSHQNVENVEKPTPQKGPGTLPEYAEKQTDSLPKGCPLLGRAPVPAGCRFEKKFFRRMTREGVLKMGGPCPVRRACGMGWTEYLRSSVSCAQTWPELPFLS